MAEVTIWGEAPWARPGRRGPKTIDLVPRPDPDPTWRAYAACLDEPVGTMWPTDAAGEAVAKAVCRGCLARLRCLKYALDSHEEWNIWGGLTPAERAVIVERRRAKADQAGRRRQRSQ